MRGSTSWLSTSRLSTAPLAAPLTAAARFCALSLVGLAILLCAPIRPTAIGPTSSEADTPLTVTITAALTAPSPSASVPLPLSSAPLTNAPLTATAAPGAGPKPASVGPRRDGHRARLRESQRPGALAASVLTIPAPVRYPAQTAAALRHLTSTPAGVRLSTSVAGTQAIDALTARLIDGRARTALPRGLDLGTIRVSSGAARTPAPHTASIFGESGERSGQSVNPARGSVTGAAVAFGAPEAGKRGGVGSPTISTSGSAGGAAAMISALSELAVHAGLTVARDTTRSGTIHASIQPLDRPG